MYEIRDLDDQPWYACGACGAYWCSVQHRDELRISRFCYQCGHDVTKEERELSEPPKESTIQGDLLSKLTEIIKEVRENDSSNNL